EVQTVDRYFFRGENQVAAKAHWSKIATLLALAATLQPCGQNPRVGCLDLGRPGESNAIRANRETATHPHLGHAGCAEFKTIETPSVCAAVDVATQVLDTVPSQCHQVDAEAELHRHRGTERGSPQFGKLSHDDDRRLACTAGAGDHSVNVNLSSGQNALEAWIAAEF